VLTAVLNVVKLVEKWYETLSRYGRYSPF
jgi:hypothetical protein